MKINFIYYLKYNKFIQNNWIKREENITRWNEMKWDERRCDETRWDEYWSETNEENQFNHFEFDLYILINQIENKKLIVNNIF